MINVIKKIISSEVSKKTHKQSYSQKIATDADKVKTFIVGKLSH